MYLDSHVIIVYATWNDDAPEAGPGAFGSRWLAVILPNTSELLLAFLAPLLLVMLLDLLVDLHLVRLLLVVDCGFTFAFRSRGNGAKRVILPRGIVPVRAGCDDG